MPRSWLLSYTTHACLPSGWKTIRFGLPRPSGMVPTTSSVEVSMTEMESDLVLVIRSVVAAAGVTHAAIRTVTSHTPVSLTIALLDYDLVLSMAVIWTFGGAPRRV